ncbi:MAG: fused MFS/spermidine synthase [Alphaproteobacteria bacterium]|nr:fused MFS/spermidine synthase [Alphaproteobacteria bacterium]
MDLSLECGASPLWSARRNQLVLAAYTAAIFVSALLLFSVQPLFTKMVLPQLGGSPAVWSVAMVFFQSLLLAGYVYAHLLMKIRNRVLPVVIHLILLVVAFSTLPLGIATAFGEPPQSGYAIWLLGLFAVSIGLPFFALSANNPLLQAWFVRTGHSAGRDPYFLYASSNIGSFLALLSYPVLVEPLLALRSQNGLWSGGFAVLIVLIASCAVLLLRSPAAVAQEQAAEENAVAPSWGLRGRWILLSAVPSGLLIAVTAHISADVAAAPLLWVMPLALYLLTWVLVFQSRPLLGHKLMLALQPIAIVGTIAMFDYSGARPILVTLSSHLLCFFVLAMGCHGELARTRPAAKYLTGFYVALSFGGMVGGLFAGLVAPFVFSWVAEYPILIALVVLCNPKEVLRQDGWWRWYWAVLAVIAVLVFVPVLLPEQQISTGSHMLGDFSVWLRDSHVGVATAVGMFGAAAMLLGLGRWKYFAAVAVALALVVVHANDSVETARSFFGVHKILKSDDGRFHVLAHGTTVHGAERVLNNDGSPVVGRPELISYYHKDGGIGQVITAIRARKGAPLKVAVIGLGAGTLVCAAAPGEDWRFFEIDQSMVATARNPKYFHFISACAPDLQPVIGDARLTFAKEAEGVYDLVIVDAYSSDAIPIHLATAEAMKIYKDKLAPDGVVMMHVSNRHLDLEPVVVGIAGANGLRSWAYKGDTRTEEEPYIYDTRVVVSARTDADVGGLASSPHWTEMKPDPALRVWTDDYSNILGAIYRRLRG